MGRNLHKLIKIFAEYLKTVELIFTKLMSFLRLLSTKPFEMKRLKAGHPLLSW